MLNPTLTLIPDHLWPNQGDWTYEDYQHLPDDGRRYEIIEGILYMANAPSYEHQLIVGEIFGELRQFVKSNNQGLVLTAPFEVHLSAASRPVQPDVLFIKAEKQPAINTQIFEGGPDLVVEVLSPSTAYIDRYVKFDAYEQVGMSEYWIVNPKTASLEVYTLSGGEYALLGQFTADEPVWSALLPDLAGLGCESYFWPFIKWKL